MYGVGKSGFFQHFHAVRQQAFADDEARKVLFLQYADFITFFVKQGGCYRACRTCADHGDIELRCGHLNILSKHNKIKRVLFYSLIGLSEMGFKCISIMK